MVTSHSSSNTMPTGSMINVEIAVDMVDIMAATTMIAIIAHMMIPTGKSEVRNFQR